MPYRELNHTVFFLFSSLSLSHIFQKANYFGSLLQASTVCLGSGIDGEVNVPFRDLLPMVHPNDIIFDGTDNCRDHLLKVLPLTKKLKSVSMCNVRRQVR